MDEDSDADFYAEEDDDDAGEDIQIDDLEDGDDDDGDDDDGGNFDDDDDDDDEDFAGAGDDAFSTDAMNKGKLKPHQVEFKCHSIDSLQREQAREVAKVASMFSIKDTDAAILLRHLGWNSERLTDKYLDDADALKLAAGVVDGPGRPRIQSISDFTCEICYLTSSDEDDGLMATLALGCGHRFCKDCYQQYVEQKVKQEGESRRVQCMQEKCQLVLDEKTVELITSPEVYDR